MPHSPVYTCPYHRERVLLLVLQVLLNVEERVKEDVGQLAPLQVTQCDLTWTGLHKHLSKTGATYAIHFFRITNIEPQVTLFRKNHIKVFTPDNTEI